MADLQTFPSAARHTVASAQAATAAWSAALGGLSVVLAPSAAVARRAVMAAAGVRAGDPVELPTNAGRALVEAVADVGARPRFRPFGPNLTAPRGDAPWAWAQTVGGLVEPSRRAWTDGADTLPDLSACWACARLDAPGARAPALLFGLHLSADPASAGALVVCGDPEFAAGVRTEVGPSRDLDWGAALAQCDRLANLARAQRRALAELRRGVADAAGLPLAPETAFGALPHGVAVRIPDEAEPSTFLVYLRAERTRAVWLPELAPVHYAAFRGADGPNARSAAAELSRWLLVPTGPGFTPEEIAHAVLGVVKASEYLGVRWRTDSARAHAYGADLTARYGPGHDAYQPVFDR